MSSTIHKAALRAAGALILGASIIGSAAAASVNQVPSCYAAGKLELAPQAPQRAFFIVLDETVVLDDSLKRSLWELVRPQLTPGTAFSVFRFSAFSQGKYLDIVASGELELPVPAKIRDSISVPKLRTFEACLKGQGDYGMKLTRNAMGKVLQASSFDLGKSDIEGSLVALAKAVRETKAPVRTVLLVSDMLENSSVSSFYQNKGVRNIDPAAELKKTEAARLFADFGGASVYVMGAGLIEPVAGAPAKTPAQYRDTKTMTSLERFWAQYFEKSNARLEAFGAPALLTVIK